MTAIRDDIIMSRPSLKRSVRDHLIITPSLDPNIKYRPFSNRCTILRAQSLEPSPRGASNKYATTTVSSVS